MIRLNVRMGASFNRRTWLEPNALIPIPEPASEKINARIQYVDDVNIATDKIELET